MRPPSCRLADLNARRMERGLELTLASDLLFDSNAVTVKPGAELALGRLGTFMMKNQRTRIIVEGHTDARGSEALNQELSERRAQAVAAALEADGIAAERIRTAGRQLPRRSLAGSGAAIKCCACVR